MGGSQTRRTARTTLLLLALAAVVTAAVAAKLRPDSAADWVGVVGGVLGPPGLYLAWASYRDDRAAEVPTLTLAEVADQLAVAVRDQWAAEVELRRLNDPYALPVRWEPAPAELVEDWATIERLATGGGAGWPPPPAAGAWALDPAALAGTGGQLVEVLDRIPTGRLVVLGEPGAGKTILLVRLVVDLLADGRRRPGEPVPVPLTLASWDPSRQRLDDWVESRLVADYPGLADPAPDATRRTRGRRLWEAGLLLPLLDGLDEIPDAVRDTAIANINEVVRPGQGLVVTSRTDPYRAALHPPGRAEVRLTGAAGIQLCPLHADDVVDYLRDSAGGPTAVARWDPVLATLTQTPAPPAAQALTTPLMAFLTRVVYNPRPGEPATAVGRSPAELLDPVRFPTRTSVERHLFDGYLPAAYRPHPDPAQRCEWKLADAEHWLVFLARHLEHTMSGTPNLAWWQIALAFPPHRPRRRDLIDRLVASLVISCGVEDQSPRQAARWRIPPFGELVIHVVTGLACGLVFAFGLKSGLGLAVGLIIVPMIFISETSTTPVDPSQAASPISILEKDRSIFRVIMIAAGVVAGIAMGGVSGVLIGSEYGLIVGLGAGLGAGSALGLWTGLVIGLNEAPSGMFLLARVRLAARGQLPRNLMAFLDDAHRRGVLRQAGAVYQFRHIELQRRLASR